MSLNVACPCGQVLIVDDQSFGRHVACPRCGQTVAVEAPIETTAVSQPLSQSSNPPSNPPAGSISTNSAAPSLAQSAGEATTSFAKNWLVKLLVVGLMFLVCAPVLAYLMRPWDDVVFHLLGADEIQYGGRELVTHNQHMTAKGQIDVDSIYVVTTGIFTREHQYFFQLTGQANRQLFFFVNEGPLHQRMSELLGDDTGEEAVEKLAELIIEPVELSGRVHQSDASFIDPFITCPDRDDIGFELYIEDHLGLDVDYGPYWMVVVGDTPSLERFLDSNGAVFAFGLVLGLGALSFAGFWFFRNK